MRTIAENETAGLREQMPSECPASKVSGETKRAATYLGAKANQATEAVGAGMGSLGDAIRAHEPAESVLHNAGEAVAAKLVGGGRYLERQGLQGIGEDVTNAIRRNPIPALLVGVGVGILLARAVGR